MRGVLVFSAAVAASLVVSGCRLPGSKGPLSRSLAASRQFCRQGAAAMEQNHWEEAERLLRQAVRTCPENPEARRYWAEVLWRRGDRLAALSELEAVGRQLDADADVHVRIAQMQFALGQMAPARQSAEQAIDLNPKSAAAWAMRGRVMHAAGRTRGALADFHRALALAPLDRAISWEIAEVYRELGQPQRALAALNSLADTYAPGDEPQRLLYEQGLAYTALGRYDDAVESLTAAVIRRRPTAEILYRLAEAQMAAGRADRAATTAREALALDPRHQPSRQLLGRTELALRSAGPANPAGPF